MINIIRVSDAGIVVYSNGKIWQLTKDNQRLPVTEGEWLPAGTVLMLEENADIRVETNESPPFITSLPSIESSDKTEDRPTPQKKESPSRESIECEQNSEALFRPPLIPLKTLSVTPKSGFHTQWQSGFADSHTEDGSGEDDSSLDVIATITINSPVTSDNIVNHLESLSLTVSGTVFDIEAFRPVLITLTDSTGHQLQQDTCVDADGVNWSTDFNEQQLRNLVDGDIRISAEVSDLSGNVATASILFLLDTSTEVTIGLAQESDSCYGQPDHPGTVTNVNTPVITGTGEPGSSIVLLIDGSPEVSDIPVDSTGHWSSRIKTPLSDGSHTFTAEITDIPSNISSAEFSLTIDTSATIWINNLNSYNSSPDGTLISGETKGVRNNQLVKLDFRSDESMPIRTIEIPVTDGKWSSLLPPTRSGIQYIINVSVEDQACSTARDEMVPLGNPLALLFKESLDIGHPFRFNPLANEKTILSFRSDFLRDLPSDLSAIDGGVSFPLIWQTDQPKTLSAVYQNGTLTQTAFSVSLPESGVNDAEATLFKPLLHLLGTDTGIRFTIPYLKSLYSETYQETHQSIAGIPVTIFDDAPALLDHTPVQLAEGTTAQWDNNNGKLFTPEQAGADGGQLISVNGAPLDSGTQATTEAYSGYYQFPGSYGSFFVTQDGVWNYQAKADLMHSAGASLSDTFSFVVADTEGDTDSAHITFNVVDGTPLSFSSSSVSALTIDQECDQPGPMPDNGSIEVNKGSDPLLPNKLQINSGATATLIYQSMGSLSPNSEGVALDLENLYPGTNNQDITLSTILGKPIFTIRLQSVTAQSNGSLTASLSVLQKASFDVSSSEPPSIPVVLDASDQDINTITHTVTLTIVDGEITLKDDSITSTEGQTVTGNLLTNDLHCLDPVYVTGVDFNPSVFSFSSLGQGQSYTFEVNTTIPTRYGDFIVQSNGDYSFSAKKGLINAEPVSLQFTYTVSARDSDTANASAFITINDGNAPSGGELVSLSFTENNLVPAPRYPVDKAGTAVYLNADGSDPIALETLSFTITPSELDGIITSLGSALRFNINGNAIEGTVAENGITTPILTMTLRFADTGKRNPPVRMFGELDRPLDHLEGIRGNSHVEVNGERIILTLPFTYQDIDGSQASQESFVVTTIFDGNFPVLMNPGKLKMVEKNLPVESAGTIETIPNSDQIVPTSWHFLSEQPGLLGLYANNQPLSFTIQSQTITLYTTDQPDVPVLSMTLVDIPKPPVQSLLHYSATLHQPMNQNQGTWPLSIQVSITDSDGDTTQNQLKISIKDHDSLELSLVVNELSLREPIYQNSINVQKVGLVVTAGTDAVTQLYFVSPSTDSKGYATDDDGNVLTADGLPIQFLPTGPADDPNETLTAWSINNGSQVTRILSISTLQPDGSSIYVDSGDTVNAYVTVSWYSLIDHLNPANEHIDLRSAAFTLQAVDTDGSRTTDRLTLFLYDGDIPLPVSIDQPPVTKDVNKGSTTRVEGTLHYQTGSDQPLTVFDLQAIKEEFSEFSSDGFALTGYTLSGPDQSVLTISRANDSLPVFRLSVISCDITQAKIQIEQLDTLDHPPTDSLSDHSIVIFWIPMLLSDSDKSLNTNPMSLKYTVMDTVPTAHGDYFKPNDQPIKTEGYNVGFSAKNSLLANDDLGADADNAFVHSVTVKSVVYPVSSEGTTIDTVLGRLTVKGNGQWQLITAPHIDHSAGQNFTLKMTSTTMDGDGDDSSAPFEITIKDQPAAFQNIEDAQGMEDTLIVIPVKFALNLGDLDRHETISNLFIQSDDLQGGQLTWNDAPLPVTDLTINIPDGALISSTVSGSAVFTATNLGYLPPPDASDFTFTGHQITLNIRATVDKNPGPNQTLSAPLVIHILGIADPPVWPENLQPVEGTEDQVFPLQVNEAPVQAFLSDTDGPELITYQIIQMTPEITLTGSNNNEVLAGSILTPDQFESLSVQPQENWAGQAEIQVSAIATEQNYYSEVSASTAVNIYVNVFPVADQPSLSVYPTGSQSNLVTLDGMEDQKIDIGSHVGAALTDDDGSETLFLRLTPLLSYPDEPPGSLWVENNGSYTEVNLSDGYYEASSDHINHLYYQPSEDRSSANTPTLRLKVNAVSRESSQSGLFPPPDKAEAISKDCFIDIEIKGVPDQPVITPSPDWIIDDKNSMVLTGYGKEVSPLPLKFTVASGDIDSSESLNTVIMLSDRTFKLTNSQGKPPPIASIVDGNPVYQITPQAIESGSYSITAPEDYAGETFLTLNVLVTEADGASRTFTYRLNTVFEPVVDTPNQSSDTLSGVEVSVNSSDQYVSGGAPLSLKDLQLKDSDGSESITDMTAIDLPSGFKVMVNDRLVDGIDGSLASLLGGIDALKSALESKKVLIVPVNADGTLNPDYPTNESRLTDFTFNLNIHDSQNGLSTNKVVTINCQIKWYGEVDGGHTSSTPTNPNENTQVTIGNPEPLSGNNFPLTDLKLVSTDVDGSESLMTDKVPQYEINVFNQATGQMVSSGWHLQTSGSQQLVFDNEAWLVQSGGLSGVTVHFTRSGHYYIQTKGIVQDIDDQEARYARMSVTVENDSGNTSEPATPNNVVHCSEPISGSEDGRITIPEACIDLSLSHTGAQEKTIFQFHVNNMNNWTLAGYTSSFWGDDGQIISYLVSPESLASVQFIPPRDFSGSAQISYQILKFDTLSDVNSSTAFSISFDVLPVSENSPGESPDGAQKDLEVWMSPPATTTEWKVGSQPAPMNLHIKPEDVDFSETVQKVVFTPPAHILLAGNGLTDNTAIVAVGETQDAFDERLSSFTFAPEEGLAAGTYPMSLTVTVVDTAPGTGKTDTKTFTKTVDLLVTPINHCSVVLAPNQSGLEDNAIPLVGLSALLNDNDGSETLSVALSGVPEGAVINSASGTPLPHNGNGQWQIPAELIGSTGIIQTLNFQPPKDFSGNIHLTLNAYSHELSLTEVCTDNAPFIISVQPVGDSVTVDQLSERYTSYENAILPLILNARSTDTASDSSDYPEGIKVTMTIADGEGTLFPAGTDAIQPTLQIPGSSAIPFTRSGATYSASVSTSNTLLKQVDFNTGDGYGTASITITTQSIDATETMQTAYGPEVTLNSHLTVLPQSDPPTLEVTGDHLFANTDTTIPLIIQTTVVNPAMIVDTPIGTERYIEITGLPQHARLVDSQLNPVGIELSTGGWALTTDHLKNLYLVDSQVSHYVLTFQAVSDVGGGDRQVSSIKTVSVAISGNNENITGAQGDNIIIANGSVSVISTESGNDLIATGIGGATVYPGSGNNEIWGGEYNSTGQNHQDIIVFEANDSGKTIIRNFETNVDCLNLSGLLQLNTTWDSSQLTDEIVISEDDGSTQIHGKSETITLESITMEALLPGSSEMSPAEFLSALVGSGKLVVSNQYGHEGKDILHAPPSVELMGDGIIYGDGGNDIIYANRGGSKIQAGAGNDLIMLDSVTAGKDSILLLSNDGGTKDNPYLDQVMGFHTSEDVIDISSFLPKEAATKPFSYMELSFSGKNSYLNIASDNAGEWTNTIELNGIDWLQGSSSEDALRQHMEQGYLITGF